jgi:hypothetical protein
MIPDVGLLTLALLEDLTRYVTDGAGISVPSEELGFYFGGMTSGPASFESIVGFEPSEL